jgi:multidrug efflux system membrane fusion protein
MNDKTTFQQHPVSASAPTGRRKRNLWVTGAVLVVIAGSVAGAVWLAHRPPPRTGPGGAPGRGGPGGPGGRGGGRPQTTVGIATATEADIPITIDALGTVIPAATVTVTPQVGGVITEILYKEGQTVQKGQTLAVIDPRPFQIALNNAEGALARDQAQLTNAKLQLTRDQTLLKQDSIAQQDVDTQAATVGQMQGNVTSDQAAISSAQLNLGFTRVIAPVSGKVGLRPVDLGNYINAGATTGVAVITQVTPIDVEFPIPQVNLPSVQENSARCDLEVVALDQSKTVTLDTGVFSTLDNRIDTTTGTVKSKARFQNAKGNLFPNQFVNVELNIETLHNVVVVPVTAVRTGPQGDFVWVIQADKTVQQRAVTKGPATVDSTSITQGLDVGERVVTEGGDRLTDGARVQLPGDRPIPPGGFTRGGRRGGRGRRGGQGGAPGAQQAPGGQGGQQGQGGQGGGAGQQAGNGAGQGGGDQAGQGAGRRRGGGQGGQFAGGQGGQGGGQFAGAQGGGQGGDQSGQGGGFRRRGGGQGGQGANGQGGQGGGQFAGRGFGRGTGGPGGRGRGGGAKGAGGAGGNKAGCYTASRAGNKGGGQPGQGRGGRRGQGGGNMPNDALNPQKGQFPGRGGPNRRGGNGNGNQDVTTPNAPNGQPRRQRPNGQNGQGAGAGQGGGQSNGG